MDQALSRRPLDPTMTETWLTPERRALSESVAALCTRFDQHYWGRMDAEHAYPRDSSGTFPTPASSRSSSPKSTAAAVGTISDGRGILER